jgi:hypothetical protein
MRNPISFYLGPIEPLAEFCYLTLRSVLSLYDSQNSEMKFCDNMNDMLKITIL